MNYSIDGVAWKCGNNITSYQIIEQKYWNLENPEPDPEELGKWIFRQQLSSDASPVPFENGTFQILIAGRDFGCGGKSIVHPIVALKGAGIKMIIAESISRYTYRNAINLALPAIECTGISEFAATGDRLQVDIKKGLIENITKNKKIKCTKLPEFILNMLASGGEEPYYQNRGVDSE